LKEGFTVFRDQEFSADHGSSAVKRIEDVNLLRMHQFAEDAGPLAHPIRPNSYIEINNFYTLTVYEKGAEVIRMLYTILGKEKFRAGSDLYFERHDGQAVTCDDFIQAMEEASGISLQQFKHWYTQVGTPVVNASEIYDPQTQTLTLTLTLEQQPQAPQPLQIPIKIGLLNAENGSVEKIQLSASIAVDEMVLSLTQKSQQFIFKNLKKQPVVSLLRAFSAPIKINFPQTSTTLAFLLSHDTDTFNRWEAGQKLAATLIFSLIDDIQHGRTLQLDPLYVEAFSNILNQQWDDLAYFSLLLTLPAELYLAEQMTPIDVDAIHQARAFVKHQLAEKFQAQFTALYQKYHQDHATSLDADSIGKRRLKNSCLDYLSQLNTPVIQLLMAKQFKTARNMSDQITALGVIIHSQHPEQSYYL
ncbi:MAG: DUF3458 domain-containing protein, partial [Methylococcales bacterium]|nr:DUF3458 domain-containing protein [Methylococcales bacterium]